MWVFLVIMLLADGTRNVESSRPYPTLAACEAARAEVFRVAQQAMTEGTGIVVGTCRPQGR